MISRKFRSGILRGGGAVEMFSSVSVITLTAESIHVSVYKSAVEYKSQEKPVFLVCTEESYPSVVSDQLKGSADAASHRGYTRPRHVSNSRTLTLQPK